MENKILVIVSFVGCFIICHAQKLHAVYDYAPSPVMTFKENIYYENGEKLSIVDSIPVKKNAYEKKEGEFQSSVFIIDKDEKMFKRIIQQEASKQEIKQTNFLNNKNYVVTDVLPKIVWKTDYTETEKIGKYVCKKATTKYRGSLITAYYTTEIPVPTGPNKFGGLPGLILLLYNDGVSPNYWTISEIEYPYNKKSPVVSQKYLNSLPKLSLKEYVEKNDRELEEKSNRMTAKIPAGMDVTVERKTIRGGVEQKYEWEK